MGTSKEVAVFGGGCFWCTEAVFESLKGVLSVMPGYAGGSSTGSGQAPTYEMVSMGNTGYAEVIKIEFDPSAISYDDLLTVFFATHDPTTLNRQGADVGTQYRSIILYSTEHQKESAEAFIAKLNEEGPKVVTEVVPLTDFYDAEDYHRQYYKNNADKPYCQIVINPKMNKLKEKFSELLSAEGATPAGGQDYASGRKKDEELSPELLHIAREGGTEPAFTGKYWDNHEAGMYKCAVCGMELFSSDTKFDSGTGWPSFTQPANLDHVTLHSDETFGMHRTEVRCKNCGAHLGHVFDDGPKEKGSKRYCINSICLEFEKKEKK